MSELFHQASRPVLLDLFCGAGGAAEGYRRAGFDVVGVDILPQPEYPFEFFQEDALWVLQTLWQYGRLGEYALEDFAAIHASPPCQAYTRLSVMPTAKSDHPDLLVATIDLLLKTMRPFVVENVDGAPYPPELYRLMLCGSHFGLRVRRHRWFVTNVAMLAPSCQHDSTVDIVGVYGASDGLHEPGFKHPGIRRGPRQATTEEAREVMEMPWVTKRKGLTNAIPPAYAEYVGRYLMDSVTATREAA
jgi:DNA (cytosine-5)-methyltransferase 1